MFSKDSRLAFGAAPRVMVTLAALFLLATALISGCSESSTAPEITTGTISGTVIEPVSGLPVVGATVSIAPVAAKKATTTTTDANGDYTLDAVEAGSWTLTVDASGIVVDAGNPDLVYAGFTTTVDVSAQETTETDAYTPVIDDSESEDVTPDTPTILEPPSIPGLRIEIAANSVTFPDGTSDGSLNVVELGFDQGPAPLAAGVAPTIMIKIVPEGTTFDPPATIDFPNRAEMPGGHGYELFSATGDGWTSDGGASVDGASIFTETGVGIATAGTHYVASDPVTVGGTIYDGTETPLPGADVQLVAHIRPFGSSVDLVDLAGMSASSDANGDWSIPNVRADVVSFTAEYATDQAVGQIHETAPQQTSGGTDVDFGGWILELTDETFFTVSGVVSWETGIAAAGVEVGWYDPNAPFKKGGQWITDELGHYSIDISYTPGAEIRVFAYDFETDSGFEAPVTVPALRDAGSEITRNMSICSVQIDDPCGEWGNWELDGTTLILEFNEMDCGQVVTDLIVVEISSLVNGVMSVSFEEDGQIVNETISRVSESGPSGISEANLPGIYANSSNSFVVGLYADGTANALDAEDGSTVQWGSYTNTATSLTATFNYTNEIDGPARGDVGVMDWARSGSDLSFDDGESVDVFSECANGPDDGALQNLWVSGDGDFSLLLYNGEFAGIGGGGSAPTSK